MFLLLFIILRNYLKTKRVLSLEVI